MISNVSPSLIKDVVRRSKKQHDPISGLFWLSQLDVLKKNLHADIGAASSELIGLSQKHLWEVFALRDIQDIKDGIGRLGVGVDDVFERTIRTQSDHGYNFETGLKPTQWSLIGWMSQRDSLENHASHLLSQAKSTLGQLPGLLNPEKMPVRESFIAKKSMGKPLGQWILAFEDSHERTHDVLDLALIKGQNKNFTTLLQHFSSSSNDDSAAKSGYLARLAARAYDIAVHEVLPKNAEEAKRYRNPIPDLTAYTGIDSSVFSLVGTCLLHGAKLSQEAWSGPAGTPNARPFTTHDGDLRELAYTLVGAETHDDGTRATAFRRLEGEGHDVVIAHRSRFSEAEKAPPTRLPLHMCALNDQAESVAALLALGADTQALEHVKTGSRSVRDVISPMAAKGEKIKAAIRSCEVRQTAVQAIREMQLPSVRTASPA